MKKNVCIVLSIIVCCCLLLNRPQFDNKNKNVSLETKVYNGQQEPENQDNYYFTTEEFLDDFSKMISKNDSILDMNIDSAFSSFSDNRIRKNEICIPMINNKPVALREAEGYPAIVLSESDTYSQPWIWFYLNTENSNSYIKIMYLDSFLNEREIAKANIEGAEWVVEQLLGSSTDEKVNSITPVVNKSKTILLKDRHINAIENTLENDTRITVRFIYDDVMVIVCAERELLTDEWFSNLSFESIPLNSK